jgi:aromatase
MTKTETAIEINAAPAAIFAFASATERWPQYLPHYRYVRVLQERGTTRVVEMAARRGWIPVRWTAEQTNDPSRPHIAFRHVRGWTRGMEVEWRFEPIPGGTRVSIEHRLSFHFPFAAEWLARHVVSDFFIRYVAQRTLARMKALAEDGS